MDFTKDVMGDRVKIADFPNIFECSDIPFIFSFHRYFAAAMNIQNHGASWEERPAGILEIAKQLLSRFENRVAVIQSHNHIDLWGPEEKHIPSHQLNSAALVVRKSAKVMSFAPLKGNRIQIESNSSIVLMEFHELTKKLSGAAEIFVQESQGAPGDRKS